MVKNFFISYKWEDKSARDGLEGAIKNPNNNFVALSNSEEEDLRNQGENIVKKYLKDKINDCDAVVCLIGQNSHNSKMIEYELQVAQSLGKEIIAIKIKDTNGGAPPTIKNSKIPIIDWNINNIKKKLN